ncbi:hypothetical protein BASA62_004139 [Batrachochytrium salamandrivorans]|nr:hypothetical protein BASA62_004139 [Batrachochytrium salamandrivorans]
MNEGAFIGSSQSAGDEVPVEETVSYSARDDQAKPKRGRVSSMVWELYTNKGDAHTWGLLAFANTVGNQIVHQKKSERAVFASAEMQSFFGSNDVIRPNQIDLTDLTMPRKQEKDNWSSFKRRDITKFQPNRLYSSVHPVKTDEKGTWPRLRKHWQCITI